MPAQYRPVFKAKQGEFVALSALSAHVRSSITPIMEPLPAHADDPEAFAKSMSKAWPADRPFLIDSRLAPSAAERLGGACVKADLEPVPVVHLSASDAEIASASRTAGRSRHGLAIRLMPNDIGDVDNIAAKLDRALTAARVPHEEIDLIFDLYSFANIHVGALATASIAALRALPSASDWRSLTLLGTSFPENLSDLTRDSISRLQRGEWTAWSRVSEHELPRRPDFGDYGIMHPELVEIDPRMMTMSANLRYTIDGEWLVFKGRDVKKHGYEQFNAFCRRLVGMPEYSGQDFSWGDAQIVQHCRAGSKPGNASKWRAIGTSHHVTFVVRDLASFRAP